MKSYFLSLMRFASRLKLVCLLFFILGTVITIEAALAATGSFLYPYQQYLLWAGAALIAFAGNAFFSRRDNFLLRGVRDPVYLVENNWYCPRIYQLTRETVNALAGWRDIYHVSERMIRHFYRFFGGRILSLKEAELYQLKNEESKYAVILEVVLEVPNCVARGV